MSIILEHLTKRYDGHPVVNNVSLEVADGEFFVLLGSSGSGKTTVLNMVAGLIRTDQGRILLHGRDVTHMPTQQRRVGMVFQNYALFQHMTLAENIEFGLQTRKVPKAERRQRRNELLELVGLAGLGGRLPKQISGGQQQRVALARALAYKPDVLLLDEPLGALDAKIRLELRRTLKTIQRETGVTTILVTHDQEEAFELADRLGVMSFGRLMEVGYPEDLYKRPQTEFVATFLGTANLLVGQAQGEGVQLGALTFPLQDVSSLLHHDDRVQVLFRPEDVVLAESPEQLGAPRLGLGEVEQVTFGGSFERLRLRLPPLPGVRPIAPPVPFGGNAILVEATRSQDEAEQLPLRAGHNVWVGVRQVHALEHPGLRFLLLSDGSPLAQAAIQTAGHIARLAHARVTLLGYGLDGEAMHQHLQEAREQLGSGLAALDARSSAAAPAEAARQEVERQSYDLVVMGYNGQSEQIVLAEHLLAVGEHHLLLIPAAQAAPTRILICVTTGEPGKEDVLFSGRLTRHLGATAVLLSVVPPEQGNGQQPARAERFLMSGERTLELLGVPAETAVRTGSAPDEIAAELAAGDYDMLVLGAPLPDADGNINLTGTISRLLATAKERPVLVVRAAVSRRGLDLPLIPSSARIHDLKEVV
ncbi:MAG: hypothetical protein BroJett015_45820 [Chloroflexota bacterium]|nr:ATP-binding cassette domain-containing protein [Ardenticatenaceae bacterium]GIK58919.1 MAG: hypothetical protein BroJett015_45820 [Chloroflexota bacterium]